MKEKRVSIKHKRKAAPEWVFRWRPLRESRFSKVFALLLVTGLFALFLNSVRIRTSPPAPWAARKASVIHVSKDADGLALALRAREGGPFPSRLKLSTWEGSAALEQEVLEATRYQPPPYIPALRELPDESTAPEKLAARGEAMLPTRRPAQASSPTPENLMLAPVIFPLSGITSASMPHELPPFEGQVDAAMAAEPWRFLIRLDAAGNVRDCVSLSGGNESNPTLLEAWLRRVTFKPESSKPSSWLAVGVDFTNQSAHGTDAR